MEPIVDSATHRNLAVKLYNGIWTLLEKPDRTVEESDAMERAAFASLYHWSHVGDAKNVAIGEWMIAHVYVTLGHTEEAIRFAQRTIDVCLANDLADFYLAYGYLEMARALRLASRPEDARDFASRAREVSIADVGDREHFDEDYVADGW